MANLQYYYQMTTFWTDIKMYFILKEERTKDQDYEYNQNQATERCV